ncbi:hypothetical protein LY76DRAFT_32869 [Colletotrichum caudatum]|nr:hypothetical protein LY76DRAFT_32869 [Colletotrichum caudatum]
MYLCDPKRDHLGYVFQYRFNTILQTALSHAVISRVSAATPDPWLKQEPANSRSRHTISHLPNTRPPTPVSDRRRVPSISPYFSSQTLPRWPRPFKKLTAPHPTLFSVMVGFFPSNLARHLCKTPGGGGCIMAGPWGRRGCTTGTCTVCPLGALAAFFKHAFRVGVPAGWTPNT